MRSASIGPARLAFIVLAAVVALALTTLAVSALEAGPAGMQDASPLYLIAVVIMGAAFGTWAALATALAAVVTYDVLFTAPRLSLVVADPREWLDLLLFLFVAVSVGRLVAVQRRRADEAERRTREANSLFGLSRMLVTADSTEDAALEIARRLASDVHLDRVWIAIGPTGRERVVADTDAQDPTPSTTVVTSLARQPGDEPARWVRTHAPRATASAGDREHLRVRIESDGVGLGFLSAIRRRELGVPSREETRVLALAADQIGLSIRRDQLRRTATELEVARQGDTVKTALIDSVSHDLRTPLASIRATAGGLADPDVRWDDADRREAAALIDAEAARLDRLVRGVLDLGRIDSDALHVEMEPHDLSTLVPPIVERVRPLLGSRPVTIDVDPGCPPVTVDAVLFDVVVSNLLENAAAHAPAPAPVAVSGRATSPSLVRLAVDDGGPGVPDAELGRVFQRFHRVPTMGAGARRGLGIGLSVVKGLTEAMGGAVTAERSTLGGLRIVIDLQAAPDAPGSDE